MWEYSGLESLYPTMRHVDPRDFDCDSVSKNPGYSPTHVIKLSP